MNKFVIPSKFSNKFSPFRSCNPAKMLAESLNDCPFQICYAGVVLVLSQYHSANQSDSLWPVLDLIPGWKRKSLMIDNPQRGKIMPLMKCYKKGSGLEGLLNELLIGTSCNFRIWNAFAWGKVNALMHNCSKVFTKLNVSEIVILFFIFHFWVINWTSAVRVPLAPAGIFSMGGIEVHQGRACKGGRREPPPRTPMKFTKIFEKSMKNLQF